MGTGIWVLAWYDYGVMKSTWQLRVVRMLWYTGILLGIPALVTSGWIIATDWFEVTDPLRYLLVSQVVVAIVVVTLLATRVTRSIPTKREEELFNLVRSQGKFLTLYEHSPVPYLILDRHGTISMYNLAAVRILETTTEALIGEPFVPFLAHDDETYLASIHREFAARRVVTDTEIQIETVNGQRRWVLLFVFLHNDGQEQLVALVDITHQKEVDAAKSEFVALATHQLRTPISAIRWNAELLQKSIATTLNDTQQEYFAKIERNILRMVSLINDFLNVSKLEMGTFATEPAPVRLREHFESVAEEFSNMIHEKSIELERHYDPEDLTTMVDERLLHIIVSNLLSNAVKYVPDAGRVEFRYERSGHDILIVVADTGIGVPAAEQSQLFTKFFRASNAQAHRAEGTGLGLYVVDQSVKKLGGTMEMQSEEGVGTRFEIRLPYHPPTKAG